MRWLGTMKRCLFLFLTFTYWDLNLPAACKRKYFEENYEEFEPTQNLPLCKSEDFILKEICSNVYGVLSKILEN